MRLRLQFVVLAWLVVFGLLACSSSTDDATEFNSQKFYFLESLKQVEAGGRQLQDAGLDHEALQQALATLDQGLKLAFQVDREFLDKLDLRLGKNYQRYFIEGVENYRIGIEAGDQTQQREGLQQLQQWTQFWSAEALAIEGKLHPQ
jgi:hypothetical protein